MQRTVLTYGVISGLVVILTTTAILSFSNGGASFEFPMWAGYLVMLVALSSIFVATKRYRDDQQGGVISFSTAFLLGIGISAIAGVIYVAVWEIYLAMTDHAYIHDYVQATIEARKADGLGEAELGQVIAEMEDMRTQYANPLFRLPMTFLEIFPVGLIITLISSAILRKSEVLPASA